MSLTNYQGYQYKLIRVQNKELQSPQKGLFVYHFRTKHNLRYIFTAELFENNIYGIKYYYVGHRFSDNKYSLKTNKNDAFKILTTCLTIMYSMYSANKKISFAFIGSHSMEDNEKSEPTKNTKRFRIYKGKVFNIFNPKKFTFYQDDVKSLFVIKNKRLKAPISTINDMINTVHENISLTEC
jgi:hypothetical protein